MKVTPTFVQGELIGLNSKVVKSTNPSYKGITGTVIDETRNTLIIRHENKDKIIVKNVAVFYFTTQDGIVVEVDGNTILGRPEDRVKKRLRRRW
jgi:ribonuclease P protein subunit POP4